jgi:hypothetical protein
MHRRIVLAVVATGLSGAAFADYEETRELTLDTGGIDRLQIDAGAGSMEVIGVSGVPRIRVVATIQVPGRNDERAMKRIESDMTLSLEKQNDTAVLKSWFDNGAFSWGDSPSIRLEVEMPEDMHLAVDDGSGSMEIRNVRGNINVDDGSGSLTMEDVGGEVEIEDGSGSITVSGVGGNIEIDDGSGGIRVRGVAGSVTVDDGSGSIDVSDVEEDLIIVDDGSGGLDFSNIGGRVEKDG